MIIDIDEKKIHTLTNLVYFPQSFADDLKKSFKQLDQNEIETKKLLRYFLIFIKKIY